MAKSFFSLVTELETLLGQLNIILSGDDNQTTEVNGVSKDSISKAVKDRFTELQTLVGGKLSYETKAQMDAAGAPADSQLAEVWNDPTESNNGLYGYAGGAWTKSSYDYILNMLRARYQVLGSWSSFEKVEANNYLLSNDRLYILTESETIRIAVQENVAVRNNQCMFVDIVSGSVDGSGAYIPEVGSIFEPSLMSGSKFVLFACSNDIVGGLLPPVANIEALQDTLNGLSQTISNYNQDFLAKYQQSRKGRFTLMGGLSRQGVKDESLNTLVVSFGSLRLFTGANSALPVAIKGMTNLEIPSNQCLFVDLESAPDENGYLVPQVTSTAYYSAVENGLNGFVDNSKIALIFNGGPANRGGLLLDAKPSYDNLGNLILPGEECEITFDVQTRTLMWTGDLYFQFRDGNRIRLKPGVITFNDANALQVIYLSLQHLTDSSNADSSVCIKQGRYYTGADKYLANDDQIPMFWFSSGQFGSASGFPDVKIIDNSAVKSFENTEVVVDVVNTSSANQQINVNIRDFGNPNNRYIQYIFSRIPNESINSDVWHLHRARVVDSTLSTVIKEVLTQGECETAVQEVGKADFVGGTAHGDERTTAVSMFLNGKVIDPAVVGKHYGTEFKVLQQTQCYEEGTFTESVDYGTEWFKTHKSWLFNKDGVLITNRSEFQRDADIATFYNCFLPIARNQDENGQATTAQFGAQNPKYEVVDMRPLNHPRSYISNVTHAIAWGGGVSYEAEFLEGNYHQDPSKTDYSVSQMFFQADNPAYNKIYFKQGFTQIRTGAVINNKYRYKITSTL